MTTNETTFFRDVAPFEALRRHVVPELLASKATGRIQIWCGACSSGQEPYSVAMALREDFPAVAEQRTSLLATDLDSSILERARRGSYSHLEVNRGLPAPFLFRFFMPRGTEWQIREEIRQAVEFRELNLIGSWPALPRMDIVFLRNVLIYFDAATKREILLRIRDVMAPRGYLFLGSTETLFNLDDKFERVEIGRAVCFRPRG
jgi:chemotaxis protein methyltransferase CheR